MIKSISFIALTHFFQFNQLKLLRQPGYLLTFLSQTNYMFLQFLMWYFKMLIKLGWWKRSGLGKVDIVTLKIVFQHHPALLYIVI